MPRRGYGLRQAKSMRQLQTAANTLASEQSDYPCSGSANSTENFNADILGTLMALLTSIREPASRAQWPGRLHVSACGLDASNNLNWKASHGPRIETSLRSP
jgi:hypothetical protein